MIASDPPLRAGDELSTSVGETLVLSGFAYDGHTGQHHLLLRLASEDDLCLFEGTEARKTYREVWDTCTRTSEGAEPENMLGPQQKKSLSDAEKKALGDSLKQSVPWGTDLKETNEEREITISELVADIAKAEFRVWIAGGAVRDALLGAEPKDIDLAGTAPFGILVEVLQETLRRLKLDVGINPSADVLYVHDTFRHRNRVFEYAPLKAKWCALETLFYFAGDVSKDSMFRDLSFNALYACLKADMNGDIVIGDEILDPTDGVESLPRRGTTTAIEPRVLPWPSESPKGGPASRLLRLAKFVYYKTEEKRYKDQIKCDAVFTLLPNGPQPLLDDFRSLSNGDKANLIRKVFGQTVNDTVLREALNRAGVGREISEGFLGYV